jgi:DNA relaxase NicK
LNASTQVLEAVDVGVDWITATVRPGSKMKVAGDFVERWYWERQNNGWVGKAWKWNGYSGSTCDGISYGRRDDGFICRLSGSMALNHWKTLALYADNVSRLDLQVTAQDNIGFNDWHRAARTDSRTDARVMGGITKTTMIESTPRGGTFSIGSRSSDRYFRVYDKTAESEGEYPEHCWRWEVEYKAALASSVASGLMTKQSETNAILARIRSDFWAYQVTVPVEYIKPGWKPLFVGRKTDDQRRLEWLRRCIRPMVERMSEAYDVETLSEALGFHWVADDLGGTGAVYVLHGGLLRDDETGALPGDAVGD